MNTAVADLSRAGLRLATSERLVDLDTQILGRQGQLDDQIERLKDDTRTLETLLNDLRRERALWIFRAEAARSRDAAPEFLARVDEAPETLDALAAQVRPLRDETVALLERAVRLRSHSHDLRDELRTRRSRIETRLREAEEEPLWTLIGGGRHDVFEFVNEVKTEWKSIFAYFASQAPPGAAAGRAVRREFRGTAGRAPGLGGDHAHQFRGRLAGTARARPLGLGRASARAAGDPAAGPTRTFRVL